MMEVTTLDSVSSKDRVNEFRNLADQGAKDLALALLDLDVEKRLSAKDALEHPWLK